MGHLQQGNREVADRTAGQSERVTPELEDARRRFLLALRALTVRKEKEERNRRTIEQWTRTLQEEIRAYRRWRRRARRRRVVRALLIVGFFLLIFRADWANPLMWFLMMTGGAAVDTAARSRQQTATALARARDPRAVSVLAIAARDGDQETRTVAVRGLKSILPGLQASDAEHVTLEGMDALISLLLRSTDVDLAIAVLKGLEQIGDARALPAVERAAHGCWWLDRGERERVQEAARACLPYLQARAERERQRNTLLRPAQSPDSPAEILLRPAGGAPTTPEEQLLRPVMTD